MRGEKVPTASLQRAFSASGMTASTATRNLGWVRSTSGRAGQPDTSRFKRAIGLKPHQRNGRVWYTQYVGYDFAVEVIRALYLDPVDYDL